MNKTTHIPLTACPSHELRLQWLCDAASLDTAVASHLRRCPTCQQELAAWGPTLAMLKHAPGETPDAGLTSRILAAVAQENPARKLRLSSGQIRAYAAAALLLVCVGAGLFRLKANSGTRETADTPYLEWLDAAQSADGSWRPEAFGGKAIYTEALTGLALMGYAAAADQPAAQREQTLAQAAAFLQRRQQPDGCIGSSGGDAAMYNHTMATLGLMKVCDQLPASQQAQAREALEQAIAFTEAQQLSNGGWGYTRDSSPEANAGVTSWAIQSLIEAQDGAFEVQPRAVARGMRWLDACLRPTGTFSYRASTTPDQPSAALTSMGALCLLRSSIPLSPERRGQLHHALEQAVPETRNDMYGTYLLATALDATGTRRCGNLLADIKQELQSNDQTMAQDRWHTAGGDVYETSLAYLTARTGTTR
jgi:hypothetical protein